MNNPNKTNLKQNDQEIIIKSMPGIFVGKDLGSRRFSYMKNRYRSIFFSLLIGFVCHSHASFGGTSTDPETITYYLYISDFAKSFIEIPTTNFLAESSTIDSSYLAGRAPIYDVNNRKVGTCSASFLNMQTADGVFTDISNYLSADNGLIVTWFTPTTLINLELDSVIHSMVTQCIVTVTTKIGFSPFFGQTFNLIVSSDGEKIYFKFSRIGAINQSLESSKIAIAKHFKYCL